MIFLDILIIVCISVIQESLIFLNGLFSSIAIKTNAMKRVVDSALSNLPKARFDVSSARDLFFISTRSS